MLLYAAKPTRGCQALVELWWSHLDLEKTGVITATGLQVWGITKTLTTEEEKMGPRSFQALGLLSCPWHLQWKKDLKQGYLPTNLLRLSEQNLFHFDDTSAAVDRNKHQNNFTLQNLTLMSTFHQVMDGGSFLCAE